MNGNGSFPLRAFFGHHKCATGWTDTILMEVCFHLGLNFEIVHRPVEWKEYGTLPNLVNAKNADFVAYTNAKSEHITDLPFTRAFHVVRDPRDVLVSAYFSHLHSHPTENWPELTPHRERLQSLSKDEGLFCEMEFSAEEFEDMGNWDYDREDVLELKMEELTAQPVKGFVHIMDFLGMLDRSSTQGIGRTVKNATLHLNRLMYKGRHVLRQVHQAPKFQTRYTIPEEKLTDIVQANSFSNLAGGREQGEENVKSHYRKGKPGDWQNHFSDAHRSKFKEEFGDILIHMGYEKDLSW